MASAIYPKFKQKIMEGSINIPSDTIKIALVDTGAYTYSSAHEFFSSATGVVGTPVTLSNKSVVNGIFDADDATFSAVSGNSVEAVVIYKDTGSAATSPLIIFIDGISVTPNGGSITIQFDSGANKIFAL